MSSNDFAEQMRIAVNAHDYTERRTACRKMLAIALDEYVTKDNPRYYEFLQDQNTWYTELPSMAKLQTSSTLSQLIGSPGLAAMLAMAIHPQHGHTAKLPRKLKGKRAVLADIFYALTHPEGCEKGRGDKPVFGKSWAFAAKDDNGLTLTQALLNLAQEVYGYDLTVLAQPANTTSQPQQETTKPMQANIVTALNNLLEGADLPTVDGIREIQTQLETTRDEVSKLKSKLAQRPTTATVPVAASGTIPSGSVKWQTAKDVFSPPAGSEHLFDFDVPVGEWDDVHPYVPARDENYVFDAEILVPFLIAMRDGTNPWLRGHTGTGKTTLVEQVFARLNLPVYRVNLDSDITRGELVGREVLRTDKDGNTVSQWVDGIIPRAMQEPCCLLLDEIDASRPDLGFVLQRLTEGKGFMLLEDGGRTIMPHPVFRIAATANTNGRGDETGLYSGTRALGAAFVNRFKPYLEVDYMSSDEESALIQECVPDLTPDEAKNIAAYALEHRTAFKQGGVTLPCSPRDTISMAFAMVAYRAFGTEQATKLAFKTTFTNAADLDDRQVIAGIAQRIFN